MAGTAETRKGEGGALRARRPAEGTDSQSARTIDRDEQPASGASRRRLPLAVTAASKRFRDPGSVTREARPPKACPTGMPVRPQPYPVRLARHAPHPVITAGDQLMRIQPRKPPHRTPRVNDRICAATATAGSGPLRPPHAPDSIVRPIDSSGVIRFKTATSPRFDATYDTGCLAGGLENVQLQAVDGLDLKGDVPAESGGGACRRHGAGHGLPARHHVSATVVPATIRRRRQGRATAATRTGFADEDSSV